MQHCQHFSTFLAPLHQVICRIFPSSDANFPQFFHILGPTAPNICGFFTGVFLFWCKSPAEFPLFGLILQASSGSYRISYVFLLLPIAAGIVGFHRIFPLLHFSACLALLHQKSLGFSQEFPLLMQTFPLAHTNIHTAESVKFYRNSDPKQFLSVKLFFTYSKISPPEFIYVGLFFTYSKLQPETKMYVCNHFGRNGISKKLP